MRYAGNDFETAQILSNHYPIKIEIICFHCQQATEKMLKAFLLYKNQEPPKTHSLENLADLCKEISCDFNEIIEECEYLNPFGVQPRYPFGLELMENDAFLSIKKCKKILDFINKKIDL